MQPGLAQGQFVGHQRRYN